MQKILLSCFILLSFFSYSQYSLVDNNGETINTSNATFEIGDYVPGVTYTLTFCYDDPLCSHMRAFCDLANSNYGLSLYNSETASGMHTNYFYTGSSYSATSGNTSGCLTLVFYCDTAGVIKEGTISCNFSCQSLDVAISTNIPITDTSSFFNIYTCEDLDLEITATGIYQNTTYNQSDATSTFIWYNSGDSTGSGATLNFPVSDFTNAFLNVRIIDEQGCGKLNDTGIYVSYTYPPEILIYPPNFSYYFLGEEIELMVGPPFMHDEMPFYDPPLIIPDNDGFTHYYPLNVHSFAPGQVLESIADIISICAVLDHSFLSELEIEVICPNNIFTGGPVSVVLEEPHGNGVNLGETNPIEGGYYPGIGYQYCWTNPENADFMMDMGDYALSGSFSILPEGNYLPSEPLDALVGCQLNGEWLLGITDIFSIDDGYVHGWNITLDEDLYFFNPLNDPNIEFSDWMGEYIINQVDNNATALPDIAGSFTYQINLTDLAGCAYEFSTLVHVIDTPAIISGTIYHDANLNCIMDSSEQKIYGRIIEVTPGPYYSSSDENGYYELMVNQGAYTVNLVPQMYDSIVCPVSYSYSINATIDEVSDSLDFGIFPSSLTDIGVTVSSGAARIGENLNYYLFVKNNSDYLLPVAYLDFYYDSMLIYNSSSLPFIDSTDSFISFEINDILPWNESVFSISFSIPTGGISIGDSLLSTAQVYGNSGDIDSSNNIYYRHSIINSSYDPNFKEVYPPGIGTNGDILLEDSVLTYTIHFQNTGTDTAFLVQIVDTLSPKLEITSFSPGAASHDYIWELTEVGALTFTFNDILLVDSTTNEPESHGHVSFEIRVKENAVIGDVIKNTSYIYFDYNTPVQTNSTTNTIVEFLVSNPKIEIEDIHVYPNPATNNITIEMIEEVDCYVYNSLGVLVKVSKGNNINIEDLAPGSYLLRINNISHEIATIKFIKL
ncbi:MAG: hypothetical protein A2W91_04870 [Bacteroidetes bacterium GWF2_38_335]|nr:MAG: hypothetical protein A2W91_04870 [Bacteroidetes bacterium GWF2_38_335]OFY79837.1 MAG: hypothetical protein A2281_10550 [Bacteroidetes bacterium RIFOXYA12_FULL_38_20]